MKNVCLLVVVTALALAACDKPKQESTASNPAAAPSTGEVIATYGDKQVTSSEVTASRSSGLNHQVR
jgi:uncharacterized lipoprotein YajG